MIKGYDFDVIILSINFFPGINKKIDYINLQIINQMRLKIFNKPLKIIKKKRKKKNDRMNSTNDNEIT